MATKLRGNLVRETGIRDEQTRRRWMIEIANGGALLRFWLKGTRTKYSLPLRLAVAEAAAIMAEEIRARRKGGARGKV